MRKDDGTKPSSFFCLDFYYKLGRLILKRSKANYILVGREGFEPTRCRHRRILSPLRLPVPPPPRVKHHALA